MPLTYATEDSEDDDLEDYFRVCRDDTDDEASSSGSDNPRGRTPGIGEGISPMRGKASLSLSTPNRALKKHRNESKRPTASSKETNKSIAPNSKIQPTSMFARNPATQLNVSNLLRTLLEVPTPYSLKNDQPSVPLTTQSIYFELCDHVAHQHPSALFLLNTSTDRWEVGKALMPLSRAEQLGDGAHQLIGDTLATFSIARQIENACKSLITESNQYLSTGSYKAESKPTQPTIVDQLYALVMRRFADFVGHVVFSLRPGSNGDQKAPHPLPPPPFMLKTFNKGLPTIHEADLNTLKDNASDSLNTLDLVPVSQDTDETLLSILAVFEKSALLLPTTVSHTQPMINRFTTFSSRISSIFECILEKIEAAQLACLESAQQLWTEIYIYASWPIFEILGQGVTGTADNPMGTLSAFASMGNLFDDEEATSESFGALLETVAGRFASSKEIQRLVSASRDLRHRPNAMNSTREGVVNFGRRSRMYEEDNDWGSNPTSARSSGVAPRSDDSKDVNGLSPHQGHSSHDSKHSILAGNQFSRIALGRLCERTSEELYRNVACNQSENRNQVSELQACRDVLKLVDFFDTKPSEAYLKPVTSRRYLRVVHTPFPGLVVEYSTAITPIAGRIVIDFLTPYRLWLRSVFIEPLMTIVSHQQLTVVEHLLRPQTASLGAFGHAEGTESLGVLQLSDLIRDVAFFGNSAMHDIFLQQLISGTQFLHSLQHSSKPWYHRLSVEEITSPKSITASNSLTTAFIEARAHIPAAQLISLVVLPRVTTGNDYNGSVQRQILNTFDAMRFVFTVPNVLNFMCPTLRSEKLRDNVSVWLHLDAADLYSKLFSRLCSLLYCRGKLLQQMKELFDKIKNARRYGSQSDRNGQSLSSDGGSVRRNYVLRIVLDIFINFVQSIVHEGVRKFQKSCCNVGSLYELKAAHQVLIQSLRIALLVPPPTEPTASVLTVQLSIMRDSLQLFLLVALGEVEGLTTHGHSNDQSPTERIDTLISNFISAVERLPTATEYYRGLKPVIRHLTYNQYFGAAHEDHHY